MRPARHPLPPIGARDGGSEPRRHGNLTCAMLDETPRIAAAVTTRSRPSDASKAPTSPNELQVDFPVAQFLPRPSILGHTSRPRRPQASWGPSTPRPRSPRRRRRLGSARTSPNKTRRAATARVQRDLTDAHAATRNSGMAARAPLVPQTTEHTMYVPHAAHTSLVSISRQNP